MMNDFRRHQTDAGMPMLGVVPGKKLLAMHAGIFDGAKSIREVGAVFEGLKLGL